MCLDIYLSNQNPTNISRITVLKNSTWIQIFKGGIQIYEIYIKNC